MIKNIGAFAVGFIFIAFGCWLEGANFTERGAELAFQYMICSLAGGFTLVLYRIYKS